MVTFSHSAFLMYMSKSCKLVDERFAVVFSAKENIVSGGASLGVIDECASNAVVATNVMLPRVNWTVTDFGCCIEGLVGGVEFVVLLIELFCRVVLVVFVVVFVERVVFVELLLGDVVVFLQNKLQSSGQFVHVSSPSHL